MISDINRLLITTISESNFRVELLANPPWLWLLWIISLGVASGVSWLASRQVTQQTEATTGELEFKFSTIFHANPDPMWIATLEEGRCLDANASFCEFLEMPQGDIIGRTCRELELWDDLQDYDRFRQALGKNKSLTNLEVVVRTGFRQAKTVLLSARVERLSGQDCVIGVLRDISDRKLLEAKLFYSENKLRSILESITDIILTINTQGQELRSIDIPPVSSSLGNNRHTSIVHATVNTFLLNSTPHDWLQRVLAVINSGKAVNFDYSLTIGTELLWFSVVISPIDSTAATWVARDISDRKLAETALRSAKEAADAANRAKSGFIATMSHELRSPLNPIMGFSQIILRTPDLPPDHYEKAEIIYRSGEYLLKLINNILELSKLEADKTLLHIQEVNLPYLLLDVTNMLRLRADDAGIELLLESSPDLPEYICTDEIKLQQILINLLSNAIKFTPSGFVKLSVSHHLDANLEDNLEDNLEASLGNSYLGNITLDKIYPENAEQGELNPRGDSQGIREASTQENPSRTGKTGNRVFLDFRVEDTGVGIAATEIPHIFTAFTQAEAGREKHEGAGLGLAISQKFVQLLGGEIRVTSQLGQGTAFQFQIPVQLGSFQLGQDGVILEANSPPALVLAPQEEPQRILVVDDLSVNRQLLVAILSPLGFELREANNGQEAIDLWEQWSPQLIFMDLRMPGTDGYAAIKHIKSQPQGGNTIIITLTASGLQEDKAAVFAVGCDDFHTKPFTAKSIFDTLTQHLGMNYSPPREVEDTIVTPNISLTTEDFTCMPPEWLEQIYLACRIGDFDRVAQLISEAPAASSSLATSLQNLADRFQSEIIMELIHPLIKNSEQ